MITKFKYFVNYIRVCSVYLPWATWFTHLWHWVLKAQWLLFCTTWTHSLPRSVSLHTVWCSEITAVLINYINWLLSVMRTGQLPCEVRTGDLALDSPMVSICTKRLNTKYSVCFLHWAFGYPVWFFTGIISALLHLLMDTSVSFGLCVLSQGADDGNPVVKRAEYDVWIR
jgi:hypothetical protein